MDDERKVKTRDKEWEMWDVVANVRSMEPPQWLIHKWTDPGYNLQAPPSGVKDETFGEMMSKRKEVLQYHWGTLVNVLNAGGEGSGYDQLLALRSNMKERKEEIAGPLEKWEDRADYLDRLDWTYRAELHKRAGIDDPQKWRQRPYPDLADTPIVEEFVDFDGDGRMVEWPDLDCWNVVVDRGSPEKPAHRKSTSVRYRPSREELEDWEINPEHIGNPFTRLKISPSTTWRQILQQIDERKKPVERRRNRSRRTFDFLDFRLRLLENVLYRFEAFGSVSEMTEEEAESLADSELANIFSGRSTLRSHAETIIQKYRNDPSSLPEGMEAFKEWVPDDPERDGTKGRSKVSQIQRVLRNKALSDKYDNPETFCDLLERLLRSYYDATQRSETS
jgi:hypothetical protein